VNQIADQSSDWLEDLRQETAKKLKHQFQEETAQAFRSRLRTAKGWRRLFIKIKMSLLVRKKLKQALELELKQQNLPKPSNKSLW
jgi:hypothetical protein